MGVTWLIPRSSSVKTSTQMWALPGQRSKCQDVSTHTGNIGSLCTFPNFIKPSKQLWNVSVLITARRGATGTSKAVRAQGPKDRNLGYLLPWCFTSSLISLFNCYYPSLCFLSSEWVPTCLEARARLRSLRAQGSRAGFWKLQLVFSCQCGDKSNLTETSVELEDFYWKSPCTLPVVTLGPWNGLGWKAPDTFLLWAAMPPTRSSCPGLTLPGPEHLQRWGIRSSGQHCQGLIILIGKNILLIPNLNLDEISLCPSSTWGELYMQEEEWLLHSLTVTGQWGMAMS